MRKMNERFQEDLAIGFYSSMPYGQLRQFGKLQNQPMQDLYKQELHKTVSILGLAQIQ
jgi:hypothetical protein